MLGITIYNENGMRRNGYMRNVENIWKNTHRGGIVVDIRMGKMGYRLSRLIGTSSDDKETRSSYLLVGEGVMSALIRTVITGDKKATIGYGQLETFRQIWCKPIGEHSWPR